MKLNFHEEIKRNKRRSLFLVFFIFCSLIFSIYIISLIFNFAGSMIIFTFALIFTILYIANGWFFGDKIILSVTKAKPISDFSGVKYKRLENIVEEISIAAGIPKPKIYIIKSNEMNAFATGRDPKNSSIAITTCLVENLNRDELSGVIAHEISHIANYDIRFSMIVSVMIGIVVILADLFLRNLRFANKNNKNSLFLIFGLIFALLAPIFLQFVKMAISRKREFLADSTAAKLTRYPEGLASALEKIAKTNKGNLNVSEAVSHLFFVDPNKNILDYLSSTHPPIEERIKILRSM